MSKIVKSWYSVITSKALTEKEKANAEICNVCDSKEFAQYLDFIKGEIKEIQGYLCKECGCPLVAKIKEFNKCPLKKW